MPIGAPKRKTRPKPPCPKELFYEDGEVLNVSRWNRVQGSDASFHPQAIKEIPLEQPFPNNREEIRKLMGTAYTSTSTSFDTVLTELYQLSPDEETKSDSAPKATPRENEAFLRGGRQDVVPQYYLKTVTKSETLVHIIPDDEFGVDDSLYPSVGESWYTNGMIWTNTDPGWEWDGRGGLDSNERKWRCRIEIPEGTQVIMDRSPVYMKRCEWKDGRLSVFPDVLLAPGEFEVARVTRYKIQDTDFEEEKGVVYLPEVGPDEEASRDEAYARKFLESKTNAEFVDVHLLLRRSMVLPPVD